MKVKLDKLKEQWNNAVKQYIMPYRWEYIWGGILVLIISLSVMYFDFFATFRDGINFWYALFEGHPLSFYSYAGAIVGMTPNRIMQCGAAYDFTIYLFFALWNFPAWIYERISGNYAESCFLWLAWGKLMLPVISIITAGGMKKILEFVTGSNEDAATMIYAYSFSGILIMAVCFIGQYDIIGVLFAVYGLYYFLKKDYKKFYIYFSIAITCKYFALLLFICLVLIYEKRILYIIRNILAGCWLVILEKLMFSFGKSYSSIHNAAKPVIDSAIEAAPEGRSIAAVDILSSRIKYLFHLKVGMGVDVMALFMFLLGLIWVYCYLQKREETYHFYYKVIYIAFCVNAVYILYTASTPYWAILMIPYMFLMIYGRGNNRKLNVLLETAGIGSFIIWHFAREPYFFSSKNCEGMLFYYLLGQPFYYEEGLSVIMSTLAEEGSMLASPINMIRSVFYTCILILLVINFPKKEEARFVKETQEVGMRGLLAFRMVCVTGAMMLPIIVYIVQVVFGGVINNYQTENQTLNIVLQLLKS